jgi:formate dehydrogenase subunit gamma
MLASTGWAILFGKSVVAPVFGHTLLGWIAFAGKNIHNFVGPVFAVSMLVTFVTSAMDNLPVLADLEWLVRLRGAPGREHPRWCPPCRWAISTLAP